ncbi:PAS and helix-turn-helix domain-containing protein [Cupriavidus campinensis]|uniref:PAS and helix-turn-helix domain-containing protein n=1 Tax=Cupriavidus campinensis TaxID=151783 RepID=A0AAE9L211_9BURK|nr:PAS and helix-turn-helix domain-containing protein [Cupriavidus campinensis]URF05337.1 PAS and helix-turn-helix domain-containing protein [Cupriavidus campinensis]
MPPIDYQTAFQLAPVGLVLSRARVIEDCNDEVCRIFHTTRDALVGESFQVLYPTADEFERTGARIVPIMNTKGMYSDERIMKRADGELFWCHVTGRALDRREPLGAGIWTFEDLSQKRPVTADLTARERDVAAQLVDGKTSKEIGKLLSISPRTVDIYRARLMKKYGAHTAVDLVQRLVNH